MKKDQRKGYWITTALLAGAAGAVIVGVTWFGVGAIMSMPPLQSWQVGSVVHAELLSNLSQQQDLAVGYAPGGVALVPTTTVVLSQQTLVKTDAWQFLLDGQWLLPMGTPLEVRERTGANPLLCTVGGRDCRAVRQSARLANTPSLTAQEGTE